jgi:nucleoside-diphosphate-sugar epimerase
VARFHNIFGPEGTWNGGREKAPAAICRKVARATDGGDIEIWGDGKQTRSFLYIDECIDGVRRLMDSDFAGPVNIGSEEMVSINELAEIVASIAGKHLSLNHIPGPQGVRGRKSDNRLLYEKLKWAPSQSLRDGLENTYWWIARQVENEDLADILMPSVVTDWQCNTSSNETHANAMEIQRSEVAKEQTSSR